MSDESTRKAQIVNCWLCGLPFDAHNHQFPYYIKDEYIDLGVRGHCLKDYPDIGQVEPRYLVSSVEYGPAMSAEVYNRAADLCKDVQNRTSLKGIRV